MWPVKCSLAFGVAAAVPIIMLDPINAAAVNVAILKQAIAKSSFGTRRPNNRSPRWRFALRWLSRSLLPQLLSFPIRRPSHLLGKAVAVRTPALQFGSVLRPRLARPRSRPAGLRTAFVPSTYKWVCHRAKPICTEDGTILLEPNPPFQPLSVVHLTAETKNGRHTIMDVAGKAHFRSLRFRENSADVEPDLGALPSFLK
jgi:hypothetical protein